MTGIIDTITPFLFEHRYIFAFLGALFEGTNIMLLAGFLYKLGIFKFWNVLAVLFVGYIINGYAWYAIGRFGGRKILDKWGFRFFLTKQRLEKLESYFKKHTTKALIITRITYGISSYVFIIAGIFKTKWKKFFWCNVVAAIIWIFMMVGIGYSFGASYTALSKLVKLVAVWLTVLLFVAIALIAIGLVYWLRRKAKVRFFERIANHKGWKRLKWLGEKIYKFLDKNV